MGRDDDGDDVLVIFGRFCHPKTSDEGDSGAPRGVAHPVPDVAPGHTPTAETSPLSAAPSYHGSRSFNEAFFPPRRPRLDTRSVAERSARVAWASW